MVLYENFRDWSIRFGWVAYSRITRKKYTFETVSLNTVIDITEKTSIQEKISASDASLVFHLAAKTEVDSCEEDKSLGKEGMAWKINVEGTQNIVDACKQNGKKIVYVSTDFVFDGEKGFYSEEDTPYPVNWYGITKHEGEKRVRGRYFLYYNEDSISVPCKFFSKKRFCSSN